MKILSYLTFLIISCIVLISYDFLMRVLGEFIYSLDTFGIILVVFLSIGIGKVVIGRGLDFFKVKLSRLNPYGIKGRFLVIAGGWLVMLNMIYSVVVFIKETPSFSFLKISGVIIFYIVSIMVLLVNFCYFRYTNSIEN